jgi:hypothetical protein
MHAVARDRLLNLGQQRLGIVDKEIANVRAALEFRLQNLARDAKQTAFQLHMTSIEGSVAVHGREETERTFAPDVRRLDRHPVPENRQQRENCTIGEIGVFEGVTRLAYNVAKPDFDSLKIPKDPLAAGAPKFA